MGAHPRLASIARVIALLAAVEASGIANVANDVLVAVGIVAGHPDECDDEEQGGECPPGCPMCHCFHCGMSSLPAPARSELLQPHEPELLLMALDTTIPPKPDLPCVYRPPRIALLPS